MAMANRKSTTAAAKVRFTPTTLPRSKNTKLPKPKSRPYETCIPILAGLQKGTHWAPRCR